MNDIEKIRIEGAKIASAQANFVRQNLPSARTPEDYEKIATKFQQTIETIFASKLKESGHTIACKAGCEFCCYIKVDALPVEIFLLVEYIKRTFSAEQIEGIRSRTKVNREKIAALSADDQKRAKIPCPLLHKGQCTCYNVRPVMCRKYHSHTVAPCEAMFNGTATEDRRLRCDQWCVECTSQ